MNRDYLRGRRIGVAIPQKSAEISSRKRKGTKVGRPPEFDAEAYKGRNASSEPST